MKKGIFFVLLIMVFLATACGATLTPVPVVQATQASPTASAKPVEVTWLVRSSNAEQDWENKDAIPGFEAQNPNIKINLVVVSSNDFDTKMQAMIAGGAPPDVWSHWGGSGFADYVKRGLVADLTPYIEKDKVDLSDFNQDVLKIYQVNGKYLGLPILTTGSNIFYNKDMFDKAGVAYPTTNWDDTSWTYAAFLDKCKALTKVTGDPKTEVYGCNMGFWPNDQFAWMYGKDFYPDSAYQTGFADTAYLNDPLVIQAYQDRQDIVWKLHYMPDPATVTAFGSGDIFKTQKVAMNLTGGWGFWNYSDIKDFKWGAAALPYGAPGRKDVIFTDPWMMSSKTPHPQEAWTLLKYLVSPEVQATWTKTTLAPPVRTSLLTTWYAGFSGMTPDDVKTVFLGSFKYGKESPNHLLVRFDMLDKVVGAALDPVVNNTKKAADTLPAANDTLITTLKQIQTENKK